MKLCCLFLFSSVLLAFVLHIESRTCLLVRGRVRCPDSNNNHDGRIVIVRLVDARRGTMDDGYASKSGRFALYGCHSDFTRPEVHVLHDCKQNRQRRITLPVRHTSAHEYNITDEIDLSAFYQHETPTPVDLVPPCVRE